MEIRKEVVKGIMPYIIIVQTPHEEYIYKGGSGKKGLFRTREAAESVALQLSSAHPRWKLTIKQKNGVPI